MGGQTPSVGTFDSRNEEKAIRKPKIYLYFYLLGFFCWIYFALFSLSFCLFVIFFSSFSFFSSCFLCEFGFLLARGCHVIPDGEDWVAFFFLLKRQGSRVAFPCQCTVRAFSHPG
ncbi:hypothetical protein F5144DRAFT_27066 [Chaetomium tenue]|uniref:Uncharacterized protein n=1 Tax=Chaetomium tenue TaxID=1854479 RepID=A0ACB7PLD4_9PEZI|nr:hypothetical protein F5144DRAFT_27066 [Chaetomium globosum]